MKKDLVHFNYRSVKKKTICIQRLCRKKAIKVSNVIIDLKFIRNIKMQHVQFCWNLSFYVQ